MCLEELQRLSKIPPIADEVILEMVDTAEQGSRELLTKAPAAMDWAVQQMVGLVHQIVELNSSNSRLGRAEAELIELKAALDLYCQTSSFDPLLKKHLEICKTQLRQKR